jgi:oligopeptidase B
MERLCPPNNHPNHIVWAAHVVIILSFACMPDKKFSPPQFPQSLRTDTVFREFGHERPDPYYRMRERENPEVLEHLRRENAYTKAVMAPLRELQNSLLEELMSRIAPDEEGYPYFYKGWFYGFYYQPSKEYPIHYRSRSQLGQSKEILLDENEIAAGKSYCDVGSLEISPDGRRLAYTVDFVGNRLYSVWVKNLDTGESREELPARTDGNIIWAANNETLLYTEKDPQTLRPYRVFCHRVGDSPENDKLLYTEEDEAFFCSLGKTSDERFILLECASTESTEILYAQAEAPAIFKPVIPRQRGHLYDVDFHENDWIIRTNAGAPNYQLVALPFGENTLEKARTLIPEQSYLIEEFDLGRTWLAWEGIYKGGCKVYYSTWERIQPREVSLGEHPCSVSLAENMDYDLPYFRVLYTDLRNVPALYDVKPGTEPEFRFRRRLNFPYDPEPYVSLQVEAPARDGRKVPVSLIYKKELFAKGKNPLLLYGYGSYGISLLPYFSAARLSLLDRGFVLAYAHVRGGQDMGRAWYDAGRLLNKKNTFFDFIDCAEYLKKERWCAPNKIMAMGGSAGGLLMGAVLNMRPDLWAAVVAQVPFVDVVTTMLDETIPLTTAEYDEWGNPNHKEYYEYILSYSPYENVPKASFPPVLATTGLYDSQVQYWEPAKWVLRLRDHNTGNNPILLYCDMEAGHGGKTGRYSALEEIALEYTFLLKAAGIEK